MFYISLQRITRDESDGAFKNKIGPVSASNGAMQNTCIIFYEQKKKKNFSAHIIYWRLWKILNINNSTINTPVFSLHVFYLWSFFFFALYSPSISNFQSSVHYLYLIENKRKKNNNYEMTSNRKKNYGHVIN